MFGKLKTIPPFGLAAVLTATAFAIVVGCASDGGLKIDQCADVPKGAIPEAAGTKLWNWNGIQVENALADQTVLYQADFVGRTNELSPQAVERIARHVQSGLADHQPWIIDPSSDSELDVQRVEALSAQLALHGVTPISVNIATPAAIGLIGVQGEIAARNNSAGQQAGGNGVGGGNGIGGGNGFGGGGIGSFGF